MKAKQNTLLIVDDSLIIRQVIARFMENFDIKNLVAEVFDVFRVSKKTGREASREE